MNRTLKKALSCVMSLLMTVSVSALVPTAGAADISIGNNTQTHVVSDYKTKNASYKEVYTAGYAEPLDGTNGNPDMVVPGLNSTDDMTPQGLAFFKEKNWVLTTSYMGSNSTHTNSTSVIYALDFTTGKYTAKFNVYNPDGSKFTAHAGGIAVSDNNLYICNSSSSISYVSLDKIRAVSDSQEVDLTLDGTIKAGSANGNTGTSYLSINDGILWTGNFYQPNNSSYGTSASSDYNSLILGYDLNGCKDSAAEISKLTSLSDSGSAAPSYVIAVPNSIYDVQSVIIDGSNVYLSTSWGRGNNSKLHIGRVILSEKGTISLTLKNSKKVNAYEINNVVSYVHLPMSEGMFMYKDETGHKYIYNGFESAAYYYYGYNKSNMCKYPTDVIWKIDADALYSDYLKNTNASVFNSYYKADSGLAVELVASKNDETVTRVMKDDSNGKLGYVYYASFDSDGKLLTDDSYYAQDYFYLRASNHSLSDITITKLEASSSGIYVSANDSKNGTSNTADASVTVKSGETVYFKVSGADSISAGDFSVSAEYSIKELTASGSKATGTFKSSAYFRLVASVVGNTGNYARYYNSNSAYDILAMAGINQNGSGQSTALPIWQSKVTYNSPADISRSMDKNSSSNYLNKNYKNNSLSTSMSDYDSSGATSGATTTVKNASVYYNINSAKYKNLLSAGIIWSIGIWKKAPNNGTQYFGSNTWSATSSDNSNYGTLTTKDILVQYPTIFDKGSTGYRDSEKLVTSITDKGTTDTYLKSDANLFENPGIYTADNSVQAWHGSSATASNVFGKISVTINAYNASELANLVHKCENTAFISERYDETLWSNYQKALSAAMNRVGAYGQTQQAMDTAYSELENAYNALIKEDASVFACEIYEVSHNLYTGRSAESNADNTEVKYYIVSSSDSFTPEYIDDSVKSGYTLSLDNKINVRDAVSEITVTPSDNGVSKIDINYYASKINVKFVNSDSSVLQSSDVFYGETPVYSGETPEINSDENNHYVFSGWDKEITKAETDVTYTAVYNSINHTFSSKITKEPTCTALGERTYTCSDCGYFYTDTIQPTGHTQTVIPAVDATCEESGLTEGVKCSVCGETLVKQEVINAKGHSEATREENRAEPTCADDGSYTLVTYCTVCDKVLSAEVKTIPATGLHSYVDTVTEPTCTQDGYTTHTCSVCGDTYTDSYVEKTGHTEVIDEAVPASCESAGKTQGVHCSVCGTVITAQEEIPALGHKWGEWVRTKDSTCSAHGEETRVCSNCNKSETNALELADHHEVTREGTKPTCTKDGLSDGTYCDVCGKTLKEQTKIKATGHVDSNGDKKCDVCGADMTKKCTCFCHSDNFFSKLVRIIYTIFSKLTNKKVTCCDDMVFWNF